MFRTVRTRIALAAATAAIVATSFVPAIATFAAPLAPTTGDTAQQFVFKPDIEVTYMYSNNAGTDTYKIRNIGSVESGMIVLKGECSRQEQNNTFHWILGLSQVAAPLKENQSRLVSFKCSPGGYLTTRLTATTANDLDTSNNRAVS